MTALRIFLPPLRTFALSSSGVKRHNVGPALRRPSAFELARKLRNNAPLTGGRRLRESIGEGALDGVRGV
jgi:hypothetical protein